MAAGTRSVNAYAYRRANAAGRYYTDGNTVRVSEPEYVPVPKRRRRRVHRQDPRYREAERSACVSLNFPLTMLLVAAVAISVFVGYKYLCLKSSLDMHMSSIKTLETQLDTLRTENDALEKSIDTSVDLNEVYETAVNKLGMVKVGQDNIIQYDKTESEYVKQYEDIPSGQ